MEPNLMDRSLNFPGTSGYWGYKQTFLRTSVSCSSPRSGRKKGTEWLKSTGFVSLALLWLFLTRHVVGWASNKELRITHYSCRIKGPGIGRQDASGSLSISPSTFIHFHVFPAKMLFWQYISIKNVWTYVFIFIGLFIIYIYIYIYI